jgi:hypothetical protein
MAITKVVSTAEINRVLFRMINSFLVVCLNGRIYCTKVTAQK